MHLCDARDDWHHVCDKVDCLCCKTANRKALITIMRSIMFVSFRFLDRYVLYKFETRYDRETKIGDEQQPLRVFKYYIHVYCSMNLYVEFHVKFKSAFLKSQTARSDKNPESHDLFNTDVKFVLHFMLPARGYGWRLNQSERSDQQAASLWLVNPQPSSAVTSIPRPVV